MTSRVAGIAGRAPHIANREGITSYDVRWRWADPAARGGFTAVLRVRDEARNMRFVLPGLARTADRILLIDNLSVDGTAEEARRVAREWKFARKLDVIEYPFEIARCGREHRATPPDSVHSLTHFYNWAFSLVETPYALKWDGDMMLTLAGERALQDASWKIATNETVVLIPRAPLWVRDAGEAFADLALENVEPWGWPNRPGYCFGKGLEWEIGLTPGTAAQLRLPKWSCFELKWIDEDEFAHWTAPEDFEDSVRTSRKRREWTVQQALLRRTLPEGVVRLKATADAHVVAEARWTLPKRWRDLAARRSKK